MKQMFRILTLMLVMVGTNLSAQNYYSNDCCPQTSCSTPCCDYSWPQEGGLFNCCGNDWCDLGRLALRGEFIYWRADQDNTVFARVVEFDTTIPDTTIINTNNEQFDYDFKPGFRVGLNYQLPCDCWDTDVAWTHWYGKQSKNIDFDDPLSLIDQIDGSHRIHFNDVNWVFGRRFYVSQNVSLRPYIGVKF